MSALSVFRIVSVLEAVSFLLLLGIAMPLKYYYDTPEMVQIVGMIHGVLFLLYVAGAFYLMNYMGWTFKTLLIILACSLIPFGPFYVEKQYL
jgi:integral membrane protein